MSWWPSSAGAAPRFATRRSDLPTEGAQTAAVARRLGTPLTPAQQYVADVSGERLPSGAMKYPLVIWSTPRQTGKTTLIRADGTQCAMRGRDTFYTAQTGKDARARWNDLVKALRVAPAFSPLVKSGAIKIALRGGSEHVMFPGGGVFQVFAPTPESLHGYTPARVKIDEAFAQSQASGELLMGAIEPAQQTVIDRQIWLVSTRGTAESTWFHDFIDQAEAGVPGIALFDFGASEHHDPFNLDHIAEFHPGVGQVLNGKLMTPRDILDASHRISRAEYIRAYANRTTPTTSNLIPLEDWRALAADITPPDNTRDITLAYDVDEHERSAAIVAVWTDHTTGLPAVKLVQSGPGASWLVGAVDALDHDWRPREVVAIGHGPVLDITAQLKSVGVDVTEMPDREFAAATTAALAMIRDRQLVHDGTAELADSMTGLVTRTAVVDGIAFSRRHSTGQPSIGIAATAGLARHRRADDAPVMIRFAS